MHKDVILNRLCYDRIKIREQSKHYERLLEVKPTLDMKPPRPKQKVIEQPSLQNCQTKKERMQIDKNVEIQKANRIMLRKLIDIDLKHTDLNKRRLKPVVFKIRSQSTGGRSNHPQLQVNLKTRIEEIRKITGENKIILKKLQDIKPSYDHKQWETDSKQMHQLSTQMSHNAGRYTKHPFFTNKNPAAEFYRNTLRTSSAQKRNPNIILKDYQQFSHTFYNGFSNGNKSLAIIPTGHQSQHAQKKKKKKKSQNHAYSNGNLINEDQQNLMNYPFFLRRDQIDHPQQQIQNMSQDNLLTANSVFQTHDGFSNLNSVQQIGVEQQQFNTMQEQEIQDQQNFEVDDNNQPTL